ncbi:hypothetical protein [Hyphomicrobium sp.]|uniref:hypothetical protein n=1 Tax=Hyphomicrobium sp. TaxID=82 RepID=UPI0025BDBCB3|nr:hypothetical protein [Hyphomicrobium sp.]MCC7251621.1 hypothetical protein [Hyphomicrobium sp.]
MPESSSAAALPGSEHFITLGAGLFLPPLGRSLALQRMLAAIFWSGDANRLELRLGAS